MSSVQSETLEMYHFYGNGYTVIFSVKKGSDFERKKGTSNEDSANLPLSHT